MAIQDEAVPATTSAIYRPALRCAPAKKAQWVPPARELWLRDDEGAMTRQDYDVWAATYDVVDNPLVAMATVALEAIAGVFAGARVLELGCGTARNAVVILAGGAREYVGVDASAEMLARGRARVAGD
ncbi:MAG TPA: class I SAM-dependent methyltransferase, partial [Polyangia bacterium]|nr:class I SAM-dependent methyltransferase [Polyangia bacterium]